MQAIFRVHLTALLLSQVCCCIEDQSVSLIINIFLFAILIQVIISWINPGSYNPVLSLIHSLTEPLLAPVRRRMPDMGGLDLSPMVVIIGLVVLEMLLIPPLKDTIGRLI